MRPIRTKGTEHLQQTQEVTAKIPERCDNAVAALPAISTKSHRFLYRPTGKSFWKRGVRGGRTFFQKGFPPRKLFSLLIYRPCLPSPKQKIPGGAGTKKDPLAL